MTFVKLIKASKLSNKILAGKGSDDDKSELATLSKTVKAVQSRQPEPGINELLERVNRALEK